MLHSKSLVAMLGAWALLGCSGTSSNESGAGGTTNPAGGASSVGGTKAVGGTGTKASSGGVANVGGTSAIQSGVGGTTSAVGTGGVASTAGGVSSVGGSATSPGGTGALGGTGNIGGTSANVGGKSSGVGGTSANVGGKSSGAGGTSANIGGTKANVGGTSANVGGTSAGVGGTTAHVGGTTASVGGTSANTGGTSSTSTSAGIPVGHCGAKKGMYFPATSWIYTDISSAPVRANSALTTQWLKDQGGWGNSNIFQIDTSFVILDADATTPRVAVTASDPVEYSTDCDPNVLTPVPTGGRIEGHDDYICPGRTAGEPDEDCHMLVADFSGHTLYESYWATYSGGNFYSSCNIAWDMAKDTWGAPPAPGSTLPSVAQRNWGIGRDCTGPDAAGFPIAPLLFTIGDVLSGRVEHAIRFILPNARMQRAATSSAASTDGEHPVYVWPATHAGGPTAVSPDAPIYGSRWRLKADFNPTSRGLDPNNAVVKAVVYGLQHYGMLLSDGGNIALTAEDGSDCGTTWDDLVGNAGMRVLNGILVEDFDVIDTGGTDSGWDCTRNTR
jgi:hypothetical protein